MNIKSILRSIPVEHNATRPNNAEAVSSPRLQKGIAEHRDTFELASKQSGGLFSRPNFFSGRFLNAESLQQEQSYSRDRQNGNSGSLTTGVFNPLKHYSSIILQQGRVQLDADYNESDSKKKDDD